MSLHSAEWRDSQCTLDCRCTLDCKCTLDCQCTLDCRCTLDCKCTLDSRCTLDCKCTLDCQCIMDFRCTQDCRCTLDCRFTLDCQCTLDCRCTLDCKCTLDCQCTLDSRCTLDCKCTLDCQCTPDYEVCGRKWLWPVLRCHPDYASRDRARLCKSSGGAGRPAERHGRRRRLTSSQTTSFCLKIANWVTKRSTDWVNPPAAGEICNGQIVSCLMEALTSSTNLNQSVPRSKHTAVQTSSV